MKEKILIVDDDPETCTLCQEALTDENLEVITAQGGEEALDLATQSEFDVILSDIRMPGMNGIELLDSLKRRNPDQMVVMFSGFGDVDAAVEALKLGAFDSLAKPLIIDELKVTIQKALRQNQLRQENQKLKQELQESHHVAAAAPPRIIPILNNIPNEIAQEFIELGRVQTYDSHEDLLKEGVLDDQLYIVYEGEISVWQEGAEVYRLGRGECYGEMNLFRQGLRSQGLHAEVPSQVLIVDKASMLKYFNRREERVFKLFVFNALNSIYAKYRKACNHIVQVERLLKG